MCDFQMNGWLSSCVFVKIQRWEYPRHLVLKVLGTWSFFCPTGSEGGSRTLQSHANTCVNQAVLHRNCPELPLVKTFQILMLVHARTSAYSYVPAHFCFVFLWTAAAVVWVTTPQLDLSGSIPVINLQSRAFTSLPHRHNHSPLPATQTQPHEVLVIKKAWLLTRQERTPISKIGLIIMIKFNSFIQ